MIPGPDAKNLQQRERLLHDWFVGVSAQTGNSAMAFVLEPVSGDASFRRYFRATTGNCSWILVDAPPPHENCSTFISVARQLEAGGVAVPHIIAADTDRGFMCLSDFGNTLFWNKLAAAQAAQSVAEAAALYRTAFGELLKIQQCEVPSGTLPLYDEALLLREMRLFNDWFCEGLLQLRLKADERALLENAWAFLVEAALSQPKVFVHRDYHSRNLMFRDNETPGVLDFQDAVLGPLTYDLVSLLKDCYIDWPRAQVNAWASEYAALASNAGIVKTLDTAQFLRAFDLMGAQRHIKVLGIFSRLWLRDGKPGYLPDMPRTLRYLVEVVAEHPELAGFSDWLQVRIVPYMQQALAGSGNPAAASRA